MVPPALPGLPEPPAFLPATTWAAGSHLDRRTNLGREGDSPEPSPKRGRRRRTPEGRTDSTPCSGNAEIAPEGSRGGRERPSAPLAVHDGERFRGWGRRGKLRWRIPPPPSLVSGGGGRGQERPFADLLLGTAGESSKGDALALGGSLGVSLPISWQVNATGLSWPRSKATAEEPPERLYSCHFRGRNPSHYSLAKEWQMEAFPSKEEGKGEGAWAPFFKVLFAGICRGGLST